MITVVGYDGSPLSPGARAALDLATLVVGGRRHLDAVRLPAATRTVVLGDVPAAVAQVAEHAGGTGDSEYAGGTEHAGDAVVLASGDPGFFGVLRRLRAAGTRPRALPAVSSVAHAFARVGLPWDDAVVVSAHGREPGAVRAALHACRAAPKAAVLTGPGCGPGEVARTLLGLPRTLVVATRLGEADERVVAASPEEVAASDWDEPNVVLVLRGEGVAPEQGWLAGAPPAPEGWALPEDAFEHRDSMITKSEVRALVLARLGPGLGRLVWDVGAGSGSVAVECARFGAAVLAVERDPEQRERIAANAAAYGVEVPMVAGTAPAALAGLPDPDAVFVGGGGPEVLAACAARRPARLVTALAALDRVPTARQVLADAGYDVDGALLQSSRLAPLPDGTVRLAAINPVVVLWGTRADGPGSAS